MIDLGSFKTRSISGLSDDLVEQFDLVAKRVVGTRSGMIKLLMKSVVANARYSWEREASVSKFVAHSINDTFKMVGIEVPVDRQN